jgi:uncharacterized protein (TIRG00374 family)
MIYNKITMRRLIFFLSSLLLGIILFAWVLHFVGLERLRGVLMVFSGPNSFILFALGVGIILCDALRWQRVLRQLGYRISFRELLPANFAYFAISFLAPHIIVGGEMFQGYFLSKKYGVPLGKAVASAIIKGILELTFAVIVIIIGVGYFVSSFGLPPKGLLLVFGSGFLLFGALLVFFYVRSLRKESIVKIFVKSASHHHAMEIEKEIFRFFELKSEQLWETFGLTIFKGVINFVRIWFLILFLNKAVGIMPAIAVLGAFYLATLFPIPTALGTHDVLQAFTFHAIGLGESTGVAFTMILRGVDLSLALVGLVILFRLGLDLFQGAFLKNTEKNIDGRRQDV